MREIHHRRSGRGQPFGRDRFRSMAIGGGAPPRAAIRRSEKTKGRLRDEIEAIDRELRDCGRTPCGMEFRFRSPTGGKCIVRSGYHARPVGKVRQLQERIAKFEDIKAQECEKRFAERLEMLALDSRKNPPFNTIRTGGQPATGGRRLPVNTTAWANLPASFRSSPMLPLRTGQQCRRSGLVRFAGHGRQFAINTRPIRGSHRAAGLHARSSKSHT